MRWMKLLRRYSLLRKPTLKAMNPRIGTSIIPLGLEDGQILFQYLTNKIHALTFEGSENQLRVLIQQLKDEKGLKVQKMRTSTGRGKEKLVLLHLKLNDDVEIRRLIRLA